MNKLYSKTNYLSKHNIRYCLATTNPFPALMIFQPVGCRHDVGFLGISFFSFGDAVITDRQDGMFCGATSYPI
jgi:hypothetical protein